MTIPDTPHTEWEYPEHEKLSALADKREHAQELIDFLMDDLGCQLLRHFPARDNGEPERLVKDDILTLFTRGAPVSVPNPDHESFEGYSAFAGDRGKLVALFLGIDQGKLDDEKELMLISMRRTSGLTDEGWDKDDQAS